jgi:NCS1 family nucleobase:cation symporter-1
LGQSDWTRYGKKPFSPLLAQVVVAPVSILVCGVVGILVTSGASEVLDGEVIWQPFQLLPALQTHYGHTSKVRAAVFFAGAGCTGAQLGISYV